MYLPMNAEVHSTDGLCGYSTYIILNPVTERVTHLVVKLKHFPLTEHLVPIEQVVESTPELIRLNCRAIDVMAMERFTETEYIQADESYLNYPAEAVMLTPYQIIGEPIEIPLESERIPPDELAVRQGMRVNALDGHVGQVDEFLVEPKTGHITHLVLREGHFWGQKDVTIPVSQIDRIDDNAIYLKLDKHSVAALPAVPVHRTSH